MSVFGKLSFILIGSLVFPLAHLVPKRRDLWVFGASRGRRYADNSRYLYEAVSADASLLGCWISKDRDIVRQLQASGFMACYYFSLRALWYSMRANVAVLTHRGNVWDGDLPLFCITAKTCLIQLWHGIPLKKIAFDDRIFSYNFDEMSMSFRFRALIGRFLPFLLRIERPNLAIATSEETRRVLAGAFRVPIDRVVVTGYPRNDVFMRCAEGGGGVANILYMPTFRGGEGSEFDPFAAGGSSVAEIDRLLVARRMTLAVKLHPFNRISQRVRDDLVRAENIEFLDADIYGQLADYHLLITDYSSIYFDFILMERPVVFLPFDLQEYKVADREFYYPYQEVTPGPKVSSWQEAFCKIDTLAEWEPLNRDHYEKVLNRFHKFRDARSCERVIAAVRGMCE